MSDSGAIVQATPQDLSRIAAFLGEKAVYVHRHLDWHSTLEWLGLQPFLILEEKNEIQAILVAPEDPPQVSWIHCFAVRNTEILNTTWRTLFPVALQIIQPRCSKVFAVGLENWFTELLKNNGFSERQKIVVLSWNHHVPGQLNLEDDLVLRPMLQSDLDEVARVDADSFEIQWVHSFDSLSMAFLQSQHTTVAEMDGRIIGYEMTTASQYSAHLARLAVLPEYRHRCIARRLVGNMLHYFSTHGVMQLTVNTQNDNTASLHLYKSLGFQLTGEEFSVLQFNHH